MTCVAPDAALCLAPVATSTTSSPSQPSSSPSSRPLWRRRGAVNLAPLNTRTQHVRNDEDLTEENLTDAMVEDIFLAGTMALNTPTSAT